MRRPTSVWQKVPRAIWQIRKTVRGFSSGNIVSNFQKNSLVGSPTLAPPFLVVDFQMAPPTGKSIYRSVRPSETPTAGDNPHTSKKSDGRGSKGLGVTGPRNSSIWRLPAPPKNFWREKFFFAPMRTPCPHNVSWFSGSWDERPRSRVSAKNFFPMA
jgi:hypothetical protein